MPRFSAERDVNAERDDRRPVDGHRRRDLVERDAVEEDLHVAQRADRDALLARPRRGSSGGRSRSPSGRANRRRSRARSALASRYLKRSLVCSGVPKPANRRIVQSRPRYIVGCTPRVNGYWPGRPSVLDQLVLAVRRGEHVRNGDARVGGERLLAQRRLLDHARQIFLGSTSRAAGAAAARSRRRSAWGRPSRGGPSFGERPRGGLGLRLRRPGELLGRQLLHGALQSAGDGRDLLRADSRGHGERGLAPGSCPRKERCQSRSLVRRRGASPEVQGALQ